MQNFGNSVSEKLFKLLANFLQNREQRVGLKGQCSSWVNVNAVVTAGSILGSLSFPIYIYDLSDNLHGSLRLLGDDTLLFSTIKKIDKGTSEFNNYLKRNGKPTSIQTCEIRHKHFFLLEKLLRALILKYSTKILQFSMMIFIKHLGLTFDSKLISDIYVRR